MGIEPSSSGSWGNRDDHLNRFSWFQFCATSPNIPKVNLGAFKETLNLGRWWRKKFQDVKKQFLWFLKAKLKINVFGQNRGTIFFKTYSMQISLTQIRAGKSRRVQGMRLSNYTLISNLKADGWLMTKDLKSPSWLKTAVQRIQGSNLGRTTILILLRGAQPIQNLA